MNIAFVGFRHGHILGLYDEAKRTPGVTVVGAWEEDAAAREAARAVVTEPFYDSYEALLADPAVEAVAIGDYYGVRGARIVKALEAGKHVVTDKPLCTSAEEAEAIRSLALEKRLKVGCMLDLRYDPAMSTARRMVREGRLGRIHAVNFTGQHPLNYGSRPGWYFEEGKHGGTINDLAIHGVDMVRFVTGAELEKVTAARTWNAFAKDVPAFKDCAQFMAEFTGGMGVTADVSYSAMTGLSGQMPSYWRFTIWGEEGSLEARFGDKTLLYAAKGAAAVETIEAQPVETTCLKDFMRAFDPSALEDIMASQKAVLTINAAAEE